MFCSSTNPSSFIYVQYGSKSMKSKADAFGNKHNLPVLSSSSSLPFHNEMFVLNFTKQKIEYVYYEGLNNKMKEKTSFTCDFDDDSLQKRIEQQERSPLLKALGVSMKEKDNGITILDATTGLAEDSFIMANYVSKLILVERSPLIHILLEDGLKRGKLSNNSITKEITEKMKLEECCDALEIFERLSKQHPSVHPDIIFLDPMHEEKYSKAALPKFKIQLARKLVGRGIESDNQILLDKALEIAKQRVVFKKPSNCKTDSKVTFSVSGGRAVRYDVYQTDKK